MWEVVCYMPEHGQHYSNLFDKKFQAVEWVRIQNLNSIWERVIMYKVNVVVTTKHY